MSDKKKSSGAFAVAQRLGRSLMLPIATLPAAALLNRLGQEVLAHDDVLGSRPECGLGGGHRCLGSSGGPVRPRTASLGSIVPLRGPGGARGRLEDGETNEGPLDKRRGVDLS